MSFSGSYAPEDVEFLLTPIEMPSTPVEERERLIQSGARHYSELVAPEPIPDPEYLDLFQAAFKRNGPRMARAVASIALRINSDIPRNPILVSLVRAGTPVGVLLHRALLHLGCNSRHYSISIIRGRGIDTVALDTILNRHPPENIVFVDGWTGKGAIARELKQTISKYNQQRGVQLPDSLTVLNDLAGAAGLTADYDDYLIPSSILNSIVSGLISRSILNEKYLNPSDFHGCVFYEEKRDMDQSQFFVDQLTPSVHQAITSPDISSAKWPIEKQKEISTKVQNFITEMIKEFNLPDSNRIKPGIGEATRAVLRRMPDRLMLRNNDSNDLKHLSHLANSRNIPIEIRPDLPFQATVIIQKLGQ